jgi:hypothetical protein
VQCSAGRYEPTTTQGSSTCAGLTPQGTWAAAGSSVATNCAAGRFGATQGLTNSSCSGLCAAGYYCPSPSTIQRQNAW